MGKLQGRLRSGLKLYVRHLGWLHAVPQPNENTQRAKKAKPNTLSRIDRLTREKRPVKMPPNPAPHIVNWLIEIGLTEANGMGESPVSWREINEWQAATGVSLSAFEARIIRELSIAYIAEKKRSESENCPPPWRAEITQSDREADEAGLRMVLG